MKTAPRSMRSERASRSRTTAASLAVIRVTVLARCGAGIARASPTLAKEVFTSHKGPMQGLLLVAAGGAIGSTARYLLSAFTLRNFGSAWPFGTLSANVLGGFA